MAVDEAQHGGQRDELGLLDAGGSAQRPGHAAGLAIFTYDIRLTGSTGGWAWVIFVFLAHPLIELNPSGSGNQPLSYCASPWSLKRKVKISPRRVGYG